VAIYSCNLASVGKSTHAEGTAGAHLSYIGRETAEPVIMAEHMPSDPAKARSWMDREESADRKNARLGDKIRLALPRELTPDQRAELVRDFMSQLGGGRVPWFAGIHQTGDDRHNPHAHIFIRDRDIDSGRRVVRLSDSARDREKAGLEPKAVEWVRQRWERVCNEHLERHGHEARIDRRTLEAQGIDREPTIHIGPRAQHIEENVQRPTSKVRKDGRGREIDYPMIDAGRTRLERHAEIVDLNLERAARSGDFKTRERAKWEKGQRDQDRVLERELNTVARQHTLERRRTRGACRQKLDEVRAAAAQERKAAMAKLREARSPALAAMKSRHADERQTLHIKESAVWRRVLMVLDFTGKSRRNRDDARKTLSAIHREERSIAAKEYRAGRRTQVEAVAARYRPMRDELIAARDRKLCALQDRHGAAAAEADRRRQAREAERESGLKLLERALSIAENRQRTTRTPANDHGRGGPSR
jgi:hypothetical protein